MTVQGRHAVPGPAPRPDPDHRPSMRILLAARLLRDGHEPATVSARTQVPCALVDLIDSEIQAGRPVQSP